MHDAPGVGLAAPQIGKSIQLAVIEDREESMQGIDPAILAERERQPIPFQAIINPVITIVDATPVTFFEGCLSVAGFTALVPRAKSVNVRCLNQQGNEITIAAQGWYARILQHEIDHLHGKLCIDCMISHSFMTSEHYLRHWQDKPIGEVLAEFTEQS